MNLSWNRRHFLAMAGSILKPVENGTTSFAGWPTLARRKNGELLVVYSGSRDGHICPFGRVEMIRSSDEGESWSSPQVIVDTPIDDRDAGILETAQGTLLATTFTSLVYQKQKAYSSARWQAAEKAISQQQRESLLGCWMLRSTNGGLTWSEPYRVPVNSPHGPIQLRDGRILYPGKKLYGKEEAIGCAESKDDGKGWKWLAAIPTRPGDSVSEYHELHGVEAANGDIIVQIRNHNPTNHYETLQTVSKDGGKSWTVPASIGVWGYPSHLLRLNNGTLVMSYSHRRAPRGNQIRTSKDHGQSWSQPILLSEDGSGDLGYPSSVELSNGDLLTLWYEVMRPATPAILRTARTTRGTLA
jgi:sialidase-1